jgi:hypothetical protein
MQTLASPVSPRNAALWIVVTVRVAWEFVNEGIRLSPAALDEAREHVLRSMPEDSLDSDRAEVLARAFASEYLRRVRHRDYSRVAELEDVDIHVPRGWALRLEGSATEVEEAVYRLHYGDGLSLDEVQRRYPSLGISRLIAAREGIRELARSYAVEEGHISETWSEARLDRLLCRVASRPKGSCPGPHDLLLPAGLEHADQCPACSRAVRLIRAGVLRVEDLVPDASRVPELATSMGVFAILLHPDARKYRKRLVRSLGTMAHPVGLDTWLIAEGDLRHVIPVLHALCEEASPHRHHLRGSLLRGCGRWSRGTLLGPLAVDCIEAARSRTWSDMGAVCQLPKALPPPPRATLWWAAAALAGVAAAGAWHWVHRVPPQPPEAPIEAVFTRLDRGWKVRFDTPDLAWVDVVIQEQGAMRLYREKVLAGKGAWSTGEGDYELMVPGEQVLVVASPDGIENMGSMLVDASDRREPLHALAEEIIDSYPEADVELSAWAEDSVAQSSTQARARP